MTPTATPPVEITVLSDATLEVRRLRKYRRAIRHSSVDGHRRMAPSVARSAGMPVPIYASGRMAGNRMTSRMDACPAITMMSRSIPRPTPPAGGMPYSRARM